MNKLTFNLNFKPKLTTFQSCKCEAMKSGKGLCKIFGILVWKQRSFLHLKTAAKSHKQQESKISPLICKLFVIFILIWIKR